MSKIGSDPDRQPEDQCPSQIERGFDFMPDLKRTAAIVGIHEHITRYAPDKSELQIQGESVIKALEDAGLTKSDVDGLLTASSSARNSGLNLADYLNMYPSYVDNTTVVEVRSSSIFPTV